MYLRFSGTGSTADINTGAYTKSHTQVGTHLLPPNPLSGGGWGVEYKEKILLRLSFPFFSQMFYEKHNHFQANFLWWCIIMSWAGYPAKRMDCHQQGQHDDVGLTPLKK